MKGETGGHYHELDVGLEWECLKTIDWSEYTRGNYVEEHLKWNSGPLQACEVAITVWVEPVENHPSHLVFDMRH